MDPYPLKRCYCCGQTRALSKCLRCCNASYCNKNCQKEDWNNIHINLSNISIKSSFN